MMPTTVLFFFICLRIFSHIIVPVRQILFSRGAVLEYYFWQQVLCLIYLPIRL
jgi:hypothetical protein